MPPLHLPVLIPACDNMGKDTFELAGREWPRVTWWKMRGMRSLYITLWAAMLTSARNGYDGSLMNGFEAIDAWKERESCLDLQRRKVKMGWKLTWSPEFHHPTSSILGLLTASMSIGSMLAIPFIPYTADILGRRTGVVVGCVIMIIGVALVCLGFHVATFIVGRLVLGFGVAIAHGSALEMPGRRCAEPARTCSANSGGSPSNEPPSPPMDTETPTAVMREKNRLPTQCPSEPP